MPEKLPNIHPGEVLLHEFLKPMNISQNRLGREIGVPPRRINEIVLGKPCHHCGHRSAPGPLLQGERRLLDGASGRL